MAQHAVPHKARKTRGRHHQRRGGDGDFHRYAKKDHHQRDVQPPAGKAEQSSHKSNSECERGGDRHIKGVGTAHEITLPHPGTQGQAFADPLNPGLILDHGITGKEHGGGKKDDQKVHIKVFRKYPAGESADHGRYTQPDGHLHIYEAGSEKDVKARYLGRCQHHQTGGDRRMETEAARQEDGDVEKAPSHAHHRKDNRDYQRQQRQFEDDVGVQPGKPIGPAGRRREPRVGNGHRSRRCYFIVYKGVADVAGAPHHFMFHLRLQADHHLCRYGVAGGAVAEFLMDGVVGHPFIEIDRLFVACLSDRRRQGNPNGTRHRGEKVFCPVDGDGETETGIGSVGGVDRRSHANDVPKDVHKGPSAVSLVYDGVCLNHILIVQSFNHQVPVQVADDAKRNRVIKSEGASDTDDPVSRLYSVRIAEPNHGKCFHVVNLEQGEVQDPVRVRDPCLKFIFPRTPKGYRDLLGLFHHVIIGQDKTARVHEKP